MQSALTSGATSLNLLQQVQQNDAEAWRRLCYVYTPLVSSWARKAGLQEADAGDIVQEVFRIVAGTIERFHRDRPQDSFRGWLYTISRNEIRGWLRNQAKVGAPAEGGSTALDRIQQVPEGQDSSVSSEELSGDASEEREIVRRAAEVVRQDFEPHTWQAFWRTVVEEQTVADVAADLKMTAGAVRQAKFRVLIRLKETIGDL